MKVKHRLVIDYAVFRKLELASSNLSNYIATREMLVKELSTLRDNDRVILYISDEDPVWRQVEPVINKPRTNSTRSTYTVFDQSELDRSESLLFLSKRFIGYPKEGWEDTVYGPSNYCKICGIWFSQVNPFELNKVPAPGTKATFQMEWVPDEVFVTVEAYQKVFKPFGIKSWPVLDARGQAREDFVQLRIEEEVECFLPENLRKSICRSCGRLRYDYYQLSGYYPRHTEASGPIFRSSHFRGYGHQSFKDMFVSHELFAAMKSHAINCNYWAVAEDDNQVKLVYDK